jgi:hypothetical protein
MKRLTIVMLVFSLTMAINAQNKFSVPTLTDLQKYQSAAWQWHGAYISWLSFGKSLGKSAEETGNAVGDILKQSWNKDIGFDGFANAMLNIWVTFVPSGIVEITRQSDKGIIFVVRNFNPPVKEALTAYNISFEEYMKFWDAAISRLADYIGSEYNQRQTGEGLVVTIKLK